MPFELLTAFEATETPDLQGFIHGIGPSSLQGVSVEAPANVDADGGAMRVIASTEGDVEGETLVSLEYESTDGTVLTHDFTLTDGFEIVQDEAVVFGDLDSFLVLTRQVVPDPDSNYGAMFTNFKVVELGFTEAGEIEELRQSPVLEPYMPIGASLDAGIYPLGDGRVGYTTGDASDYGYQYGVFDTDFTLVQLGGGVFNAGHIIALDDGGALLIEQYGDDEAGSARVVQFDESYNELANSYFNENVLKAAGFDAIDDQIELVVTVDENGELVVRAILETETDPQQAVKAVFDLLPLSDAEEFVPTDSDDVLTLTEGDDVIDALGGNDKILGGAGDDVIAGGSGEDLLRGSDGNDSLDGGNGADTLFGGHGDDILEGGQGFDKLIGGQGADSLYGGRGKDVLLGGDGNDYVNGGSSNDIMRGGEGDDELYGGDGRDYINGGDGADMVSGGAGNDNVHGLDGDDRLFGGDGDDRLHGNRGDDELRGGGGRDLLRGSDGNDSLDGGNGADTLFGGHGYDILEGGQGFDKLIGGQGADSLYGGRGKDVLLGGDGNDYVNGGSSNDIMRGGEGDDEMYGGDGRDYINGGDGADMVSGGAGNDNVHGSDGDDRLFGGDGDDRLHGNRGDDELRGGGGDDLLTGGAGDDLLTGGEGADVFSYDLIVDQEDDIGPIETNDTGIDTIHDFAIGEDKIALDGSYLVQGEGGAEPQHVAGELTFDDIFLSQEDSAAVIQLNETTIRLENVDSEDLSASDFLFS